MRASVGVLCVVIVAAIFGLSIGAAYALVLPKFLEGAGRETYAPLLLGIMVATFLGGYIGYKVPTTEKPMTKVGFGVCYAAVMAGLVSYFSILITLNTRGS